MPATTMGHYARPDSLSSTSSYPPGRIIAILPQRIGENMSHANHPAIIRRLKRADGHLQAIIEMLEQNRQCLEIAQQLQAVESAIENAKKALIHDHIGQQIGRAACRERV